MLTINIWLVHEYSLGIRSQFTDRQPSSRRMGLSCRKLSQENGWLCSGMIGIGYSLKGLYLVICRTGVEIPVFQVRRSLFLHPVGKNTN